MRKKIIAGLIAVFMMALPCSAQETDFFTENGFQKVRTTAYCSGTTTANGSPVHYGGCAGSPEHMGDIALLYLPDGYFIGAFEVNDTGGEAIRNGYVIDVYFPTLFECKEYMRLVGNGRVYVKYIHGEG